VRARLAASLLAIAAALLLLPAAAQAIVPVTQISIQKPTGVEYDPYTPHVWITQVGPPPAIQVWHVNEDGSADFEHLIPLPSDSDPGDIYYDYEDDVFVVQDHARNRYFEVCPECGSVREFPLIQHIDFASGAQYGFHSWVMTDFGNGTSAGSLLYGDNFTSKLQFGDTITPNGVSLLTGLSKIAGSQIPSQYVVIDAQNNDVINVSDTPTPQVLGSEPGPPGASGLKPPRDIDVDPVNLNPDPLGVARHLVLVPVPDLGNVYASLNGTGPWQPISSTPFGRPTRVASSCEAIGVTDFTNNVVTIFNEKPPKTSECEGLADLIIGSGGGGAPLTDNGKFVIGLKAYADANGGAKADFNAFLGQHRRLARAATLDRKVSTGTKKVKLRAGRITRLKLKLSRSARSAVFAALQRRHKVTGKLTLRVKTPSGRKFKLSQGIRIRVAH
jgi:hypothetical protein